jgi:hypothetical protein
MTLSQVPGSGPTFVVPRTKSEVARYVLYRSDRTTDGVIDAEDAAHRSQISPTLLRMTGAERLDLAGLERFVAKYAGSDGIVSDREFLNMSRAIRRNMRENWVEQPPEYLLTASKAAHYLISWGDVTYDGRIDQRDVAGGSDVAKAVLQMNRATSLDVTALTKAAAAVQPEYEGEAEASRMGRFLTSISQTINALARDSLSTPDMARAALSTFDTNEDLVLTAEDGTMASITLRDAGKQLLRDRGVFLLYSRKYDTQGPNGRPGPDGRMNEAEIMALVANDAKMNPDRASAPHRAE